MLAWVVIYRRHLRQSPQSRFIRALPLPASPLNLRLFTLDFRSSLSPNSHGIISFADPTLQPLWNHIVSKTVRGGDTPDIPAVGQDVRTFPPDPYLVTSLSHYVLTSSSLSPLAATPMDLPASVANKRLTIRLNPLDATLTKYRGRGQSGAIFLFTVQLSPVDCQPPLPRSSTDHGTRITTDDSPLVVSYG
jgi:hypothetical protein